MIGSPIWLLADENWNGPVPEDFQVVGILTDHKRREKKALIGTDIRVAIKLMVGLLNIGSGDQNP